jgi:hypothetical protein
MPSRGYGGGEEAVHIQEARVMISQPKWRQTAKCFQNHPPAFFKLTAIGVDYSQVAEP